MSQQLNTTELDFDAIKQNLKNYFTRTGSEFADWNFEGSGLNTLLDILAYNTHYNAVNAHMAMNESFLDSAQLRSNVVSRAKLLGYTPSSKTAPIANINLSLQRKNSQTAEEYTLRAGTKFTTVVDDVTYTFQTIEDHTVQVTEDATTSPSTWSFDFEKIDIYEGFLQTRQYTVNNLDFEKYIIDNKDADTSTLTVSVYAHEFDETPDVYTRFTNFNTINGASKIYFLNENGDGFFAVSFGNDTIGQKLGPQNIVNLRYLTTNGSGANGASEFLYVGGSSEDNITESVALSLTVNVKAQGGGEKETVSSIKFNAPLTFISQDRAISAEDYKTLIRQNFSNIKDVSVWGGEDNDIPNYGEVNISVTPISSSTLTDVEKESIVDFLRTRASLGITPVMKDPLYTYLYFEVFFKYDVTKTTSNKQELESIVRNAIDVFNTNNLNNFDGVFRFSKFLKAIDDSDPSILNSVARLYVYKNLKISVLNTVSSNDGVEFGFELDGEISQDASMISSDPWLYNDEYVQLADEKIDGDDEKRNIYVYIPRSDGTVEKISNAVGYLYPETGKLTLTNLPASVTSTIKIKVRPASDDLVARKREVLSISREFTSVTPDIDSSVSGVSGLLSNYNTVSRDR